MIFFLFHIESEGKCGWIIGGGVKTHYYNSNLTIKLPDIVRQINRIYDGVEAETRKTQASFQII